MSTLATYQFVKLSMSKVIFGMVIGCDMVISVINEVAHHFWGSRVGFRGGLKGMLLMPLLGYDVHKKIKSSALSL